MGRGTPNARVWWHISNSTVWRWLHEDATPNDFPCLEAVAERLENFERYFESIAHPFEWKFTRADLNALITRMHSRYWQRQNLKLAA